MSTRRRLRALVRPAPGRKLPPELRAHRVARLAEALPQGVADPAFEPLLRRVDSAPLHAGNRVTLFASGEQAFAAMCEAIGAAREEVLLESYILRDDATGQAFLTALSAAAARGAAVRVLADAVGSFSTRNTFWKELRRRGIAVRLFHPLIPRLWNQLFRDHRKILVVDRSVAFTGGMNIGEEYGSTRVATGSSWRDTHARVEGPVAWEMAVVFAEGWVHAGGEPFTIAPLEVAAAPGARVLVLDSRPLRGHFESASVLGAITGAARRRLWITNAYFAPGHAALRVLGAAARRGVDVRLLLPGATDAPIVRHAGHGSFAALLRRGVRIFEYQPTVLHAKCMVADDLVSVVGSSNLDFRSFNFNAECNLVILDAETAAEMTAMFERDLQAAVEITAESWRARPLWHQALDRGARLLSVLL